MALLLVGGLGKCEFSAQFLEWQAAHLRASIISGIQWAPSVSQKNWKALTDFLLLRQLFDSSQLAVSLFSPMYTNLCRQWRGLRGGDLGAGKGISCLRRILTLEHPAVAARFSKGLNTSPCSYLKKRKEKVGGHCQFQAIFQMKANETASH